MWTYERTIEAAATPQDVWAVYADARTWPIWDRGIKGAQLTGSLVTGVSGWIAFSEQERWPITVTWAEPGRGFTNETRMMGHVLRYHRTIEGSAAGGVRIRHRVEVEGPAEFDFGPHLVTDMDSELGRLAALAEAAGRARGPEDEAPTTR